MLFGLLFSVLFSSAGSSSSAIVAPFASAGIRSVGNRLNQDMHYSVLRPRILHVRLTLFGKMT